MDALHGLHKTAVVSITTVWMHYMHYIKRMEKKLDGNIEQILEATPNKAAAVRPPTTHHEKYPS